MFNLFQSLLDTYHGFKQDLAGTNYDDWINMETTPAPSTPSEGKMNGFSSPTSNIPPLPAEGKGLIFCKPLPINICYLLDEHGNLQPLGDRMGVRFIRVFT